MVQVEKYLNSGAVFYLLLFIPGLAAILGVFFVLGTWAGLAASVLIPVFVYFYCKAINFGEFSSVEVLGNDMIFRSFDFVTNKEKLKVYKVSDLISVTQKRHLFSLGIVLQFGKKERVFIKIETTHKGGKLLHLRPENIEHFLSKEIMAAQDGAPLVATIWTSVYRELFFNYFSKLCSHKN